MLRRSRRFHSAGAFSRILRRDRLADMLVLLWGESPCRARCGVRSGGIGSSGADARAVPPGVRLSEGGEVGAHDDAGQDSQAPQPYLVSASS